MKSVIFMSGSTQFVGNRLKTGETKKGATDEIPDVLSYIVVSNESVSATDRKLLIDRLGDSTAAKEIAFGIERAFSDALAASATETKLILVYAEEVDVIPEIPKFKKKVAGPYKHIPSLSINVLNDRLPPADAAIKVREVFLVTFPVSDKMNEKFITLSDALTKGSEHSQTVNGSDTKAINKELLAAFNNTELDLIVINASTFDDIQKAVASSMGEAGGYDVQVIEILPEEGDVPELNQEESSNSSGPGKEVPMFPSIEDLAKELHITREKNDDEKGFAELVLATKLGVKRKNFGFGDYKEDVFKKAKEQKLIPENFEETLKS